MNAYRERQLGYQAEVVADEVEFLSPKEKQGRNNAPYDAPEIPDEEVPF